MERLLETAQTKLVEVERENEALSALLNNTKYALEPKPVHYAALYSWWM